VVLLWFHEHENQFNWLFTPISKPQNSVDAVFLANWVIKRWCGGYIWVELGWYANNHDLFVHWSTLFAISRSEAVLMIEIRQTGPSCRKKCSVSSCVWNLRFVDRMKPEHMNMSQSAVFRNLFLFSKLLVMESWIPVNQSINQSINQSVSQSISQSVNQLLKESINQSHAEKARQNDMAPRKFGAKFLKRFVEEETEMKVRYTAFHRSAGQPVLTMIAT